MTSCLVETVMINVEDFAETFLTCATCLSGFDTEDHAAKLLPCSHTVCRVCLKRLIETGGGRATTHQTAAAAALPATTFRCPICREGIMVPAVGGASAFPPAFIVNQLLDLLANQRRDRVPRCSQHPGQELLFCETCDMVLCAQCNNDGGCVRTRPPDNVALLQEDLVSEETTSSRVSVVSGEHNVVTLSVAMKRCSEMGMYKAQMCIQRLDLALDSVRGEIQRLEEVTETCLNDIGKSFEDMEELVNRRRQELTAEVRALSGEKQGALTQQLALIEAERALVRRQCDQLNGQPDVRSITKGISCLNEKLDQVVGLMEPRENAFIGYKLDSTNGGVLEKVAEVIGNFGRVTTTTTYPPLCTAEIPAVTLHLTAQATITAVDYHGKAQQSGGDPITVELHSDQSSGIVGETNLSLPTHLHDRGNGCYGVKLRLRRPGEHRLSVKILDRHIRGSPFTIPVLEKQKPIWSCSTGPNEKPLLQPFGVITTGNLLVVMDTGNSRLVTLDPVTGRASGELGGEAMTGQGGTGVAQDAGAEGRIWVANWRRKDVCLLDLETNKIVQSSGTGHLQEPTSVATRASTGQIIVVDRTLGQLVTIDPRLAASKAPQVFTKDASVRSATGIVENVGGEIVLVGSGVKVFSRDGSTSHPLWTGPRSQFGGVCLAPTPHDTLLCSRTERSRAVVQVFEPTSVEGSTPSLLNDPDKLPSTSTEVGSPEIDRSNNMFSFEIDMDTCLRRPAGLVTLDTPTLDGCFVVVDSGSNSVHMFRYS